MSPQAPPPPSLTLYHTPQTSSTAALILLHDLSLHLLPTTTIIPLALLKAPPSPTSNISLSASHPLTKPEFLEINPAGLVPTLVINASTVLTELPAIMTYLVSLVPSRISMMIGGGGVDDGGTAVADEALGRARVWEWMLYLSVNLNEYGFAGLWRPSRMLGMLGEGEVEGEAERRAREHGRRKCLEGFEWIERRIARSGEKEAWLVGTERTVVDVMAWNYWRWGVQAGFDMKKYSKFRAAMGRFEGLDCVREVAKQDNIALHF